MERMPTFLRRPVALAAVLTLAAGAPLAGVLGGCGGSSRTLVKTGFPAGHFTTPNSLTLASAAGGGALVLSANDLPAPVSFLPPRSVPNSDSRIQKPKTFSGTGALLAGTAYQFQTPFTALPAPITLTINYQGASGTNPVTLNIFFLDENNIWQPVVPAAGGFAATGDAATGAGTVSTTISTFQGQGVYAVFTSAPPDSPSA